MTTVYSNKEVQIADVVERTERDGYASIRDHEFIDCTIVGPAVLYGKAAVDFGLEFSIPTGGERAYLSAFTRGEVVPVGAVILEGVRFVRCPARFVSILVDPDKHAQAMEHLVP